MVTDPGMNAEAGRHPASGVCLPEHDQTQPPAADACIQADGATFSGSV
ncbi:hypothetical protein [Reticulibacter mediterranei]|nr:hypothetical protein [Reticulibacter mediterranei]